MVGGTGAPSDPAVIDSGSTSYPESNGEEGVSAAPSSPNACGAVPEPTGEGVAATAAAQFRYVRPLHEHAEYLIEAVQNVEGRYMFGLPEIDNRTRGIGKGELCEIVGFTQSGKTQLFLTSVLHNRDRRVLLFTPDETAEQVLTKLVCMKTGSNAERLEQRIKDGDKDALRRLRQIARSHFDNLLIVDDVVRLDQMTYALEEAEQLWGARVDAVGLDYLNMLRVGATADVEAKAEAIKQWTKDIDRPVICIHQGSRSQAGAGQPITMNSGKYGGEQEANFIIGVRRKMFDESLSAWERQQHQDTVSISVVKNKRPPARLTHSDGVDHRLDQECGIIEPFDRYDGASTPEERLWGGV